MFDDALIALSPFVLIVVGCAILWAQSRAACRRRSAAANRWGLVVRSIGWTVLVIGIFAAAAVLAFIFVFFVWAAVAVVLIAAISRYQDAERQSLLWVLTLAAERGIPLEAAARAFAADRNDLVGLRALNLADYLEAGVPLSLALRRSRNSLPAPAMLAADMGQHTGALGFGLRRALEQLESFEGSFRAVLETLFYLAFLILFGMGVLTFLMLKIVPVFMKMFEEFELEIPAATQWLAQVSSYLVMYWFLLAPLIALIVLGLLLGLLQYIGVSIRSLPGIRRLWWRADCGLVMRWLGISVRQSRPFNETIRLLAGYFPQPVMQSRLDWTATRIERGGNWCDVLRQARIIKRTESVVFRSAERVGNLDWALDEMADSSMRRAAYRLQALSSLVFPLVVLGFGSVVLFIVVGIMMPLIYMIQGLT